MRKGKSGLQKEVSRIFTGVQVPGKDHSQPATHPAAPLPPPPQTPTVPSPQDSATPVVTPPVRPVTPKILSPAPRPFIVPELTQQTAQPAQKQVYEKPAPIPNVYEPPLKQEKIYESPASSPSSVHDSKIVHAAKRHWQFPLLKSLLGLKAKLLDSKTAAGSKKQKMMLVLLPVLGLVLVVVLFRVLRSPAVKPPPNPSGKSSASQSSAAFDGKPNWQMPPLYPDNLRDPMVFGPVSDPTHESNDRPSVKGIVFSEDNPCAVINNRIISVGEVVQGATVVKINPDSVEFSKGDQKWTQEVERKP